MLLDDCIIIVQNLSFFLLAGINVCANIRIRRGVNAKGFYLLL